VAFAIRMELCLPRDTATVPLVRHVVRHTLTDLGVTDDCVSDVEIAIGEACSNVVEHAAGDDEYELTIAVSAETFEIRVVDAGGGLDHESLRGAVPDPESESGRGIMMMRALVDHVGFESAPERGTVVHLVKRLAYDEASAASWSRPR
jgi:serine/threonine-protein kinase RsbW